ILASEGDVQKKTTELRALYNQLGLAARRQAEAEQQVEEQKGMMRQMLERRVFLSDQISLFDQQLRNIGSPAPGNVYGIAAGHELVSQRNAVVTEYNGLGDRIRQLQQGELADPKLQDQLLADVSRRREGFMQGVLDLRQLVDAATKSYAELANDA